MRTRVHPEVLAKDLAPIDSTTQIHREYAQDDSACATNRASRRAARHVNRHVPTVRVTSSASTLFGAFPLLGILNPLFSATIRSTSVLTIPRLAACLPFPPLSPPDMKTCAGTSGCVLCDKCSA